MRCQLPTVAQRTQGLTQSEQSDIDEDDGEERYIKKKITEAYLETMNYFCSTWVPGQVLMTNRRKRKLHG
jgi:hypothetical protein